MLQKFSVSNKYAVLLNFVIIKVSWSSKNFFSMNNNKHKGLIFHICITVQKFGVGKIF